MWRTILTDKDDRRNELCQQANKLDYKIRDSRSSRGIHAKIVRSIARKGIANLPTRSATLRAGKCAMSSLRLWNRKMAEVISPQNEIVLPCILNSFFFRSDYEFGRNRKTSSMRRVVFCSDVFECPKEGCAVHFVHRMPT